MGGVVSAHCTFYKLCAMCRHDPTHFTVIRDGRHGGDWAIEFGDIDTQARVVTAKAEGEFVVT